MLQSNRFRLALAALLLLPLAPACIIDQNVDESDVWTCIDNSDCTGEFICLGGRCQKDTGLMCVDADVDGTPVGPDCTIPIEQQDCDDANPNVEPGAPELCNNADDNCNGETDEGVAAIECPLTEGVCAGAMTTCVGGMPAPCDYGADYAEDEALTLCSDGLDNDCDGTEDSDDGGCPSCVAGESCNFPCLNNVPESQCACKVGMQTCNADGTTGPCLDSEGNPTVSPFSQPEIAGNNIDDNCDGTIE